MLQAAKQFFNVILTLAIAMQSLTPAAAQVRLSMHCPDKPAAAAPCSQVTATAADYLSGAAQHSLMKCCRGGHMPCCMKMRAMVASNGPGATCSSGQRSRRAEALSASCRIVMQVLSAGRIAALQNFRRAMSAAAPALAPPTRLAARASSLPDQPAYQTSSESFCDRFAPSHGLRAPPLS